MFNLDRGKYISNVKNTLSNKYGMLRLISVEDWQEIMQDYGRVFFILLEDPQINDIIYGCPEKKRLMLKMKVNGLHKKKLFSELDILSELSDRLRGIDNE